LQAYLLKFHEELPPALALGLATDKKESIS